MLKHGRPWTEADDQALKNLAANLSLPRLAARLQRSEKGVKSRARQLGVRLMTLKQRRGQP